MKTKKWYQSRTIWGVIFAALGFLIQTQLGVQGVDVPQNADFDQLREYATKIKEAQNDWTSILGTLISAFGYFMAILGRIKADSTLTLGGIKPIKPQQ